MNESDYSRTDGAITATAIKAGAVSMRHMHAAMCDEGKETTPAMRLGSLIHAAVLQPKKFWGTVAVWCGAKRAGKKWKKFEDDNADKEIITAAEQSRIEEIVYAAYSVPEVAHALWLMVDAESVRQWTRPEYGAAKCRLDGVTNNGWLELKTGSFTTPDQFFAQFYRMRYDLQIGWYSIGAISTACDLIAVRTTRPYGAWLTRPPHRKVEQWAEEAAAIAQHYAVSRSLGMFADTWGDNGGFVEWQDPAWLDGGDMVQIESIEEAE